MKIGKTRTRTRGTILVYTPISINPKKDRDLYSLFLKLPDGVPVARFIKQLMREGIRHGEQRVIAPEQEPDLSGMGDEI